MPNYVINEIQFGSKEAYDDVYAKFVTHDEESGETYFDFEKILPTPPEVKALPASSTVDDGIELIYADSDAAGKGEIKRLLQASCIPFLTLSQELKELDYQDAHPEEVEAMRERLGQTPGKLEETLELGRKAIENLRNHGARHWYDWCVEHWGTKWNSMDCLFSPNDLTMTFQTAWDCPIGILAELTRLGYAFSCRYADEDLGHGCGVFVSSGNGTCAIRSGGEMSDPEGFAIHLWGYDDLYKKDENGEWVYLG